MTEAEELEMLELEAEESASIPVSREPGDLAGQSPAKPLPADPGWVKGGLGTLLHGFLKRADDEGAGALTRAFGPKADPAGSVQWRDASSPTGTRALKTGGDVYRAGRNAQRSTVDAFKENHPTGAFLAEMAGDVGSDVALKTLGVPVESSVYQGLSGALSGLMGSDAELTPDKATLDDVSNAGTSAAIEGVGSYLLPKLGGKAAKWVGESKLGKALADKIRNAAADKAKQVTDVVRKAASVDSGYVGKDSQTIISTFEKAHSILKDAGASQKAKDWAASHIADPQVRATLERAYQNLADDAPHQLGRLELSEAARETSRKAATPEAIEAATDEALSHPLKPATEFIKNYAQRALPIAVGTAVGGPGGAVVGAATGAALGRPGTALRNWMNNPAWRHGSYKALRDVLTKAPELATKPALLRTLQSGDEDFSALYDYLAQQDEEPAKAKQKALAAALRKKESK